MAEPNDTDRLRRELETAKNWIAVYAQALIDCFDAAIPQAMPWMGTDLEKATYAAKMLPGHLGGLNRLAQSKRQQLEDAQELLRQWNLTHIEAESEIARLRRDLAASRQRVVEPEAAANKRDEELLMKIRKLRGCTDGVIGEIESTDGPWRNEAINWGDLGCTEAQYFVSDDGTSGFRVVIEEASPGTTHFAQAVRERLTEKGWPDVTVDTEW